MIRPILLASALGFALTGYAAAQSTITGAPRGEIPETAEPMTHHHYHHHHHHWHHHYHHAANAGMMQPTPGTSATPGSPAPSPTTAPAQ